MWFIWTVTWFIIEPVHLNRKRPLWRGETTAARVDSCAAER